MSKKQIRLVLVFNLFLILLATLILWWIMQAHLASIRKNIAQIALPSTTPVATDLHALQSSLIDTISKASISVVSITISKDIKVYVDDPSQLYGPWNIQQQTSKIWWWSWILISKKWFIITNKHVVQDTTAKYSVTLYDGSVYAVDKIRFDDLLDIAILKIIDSDWKIPDDIQPASFLSMNTTVGIGSFVLAIGNSLSAYANNATLWIIWGKNKQLTINKNNLYVWLYQTDALVNPWNSWGPLLDLEGNILGITTAITEGQWIAFALPISQEFISWTIRSIETFWRIIRPIIGIQYLDITPALRKEKKISTATGIYVTDVLADLPAWQWGLKIWDIIQNINGNPVTLQLPFLYQLYTLLPGDQITLDIIRGWETLTLGFILWWIPQ